MTSAEELIRRIVADAGEVDVPAEDVEEIDHRLARLTRNDLGNARRLLARFGDDLIWVDNIGWYAWTGSSWSAKEGQRMAQTLAHRTAMGIYREVKAVELAGPLDGEGPKDFEKRLDSFRSFAKSSGNSGKIAGMLNEASPYRSRSVDDLDADPAVFNVRNGTLVFDVRSRAERDRTGASDDDRVAFRTHRRDDLITHVAEVDYDPDAQCPAFRAFLASTLPADEQLYLQRWLGYCLTGLQRDQKVTCLTGTGSNGKSTLIETVEALMGDYAMRLPFESLQRDDHRSGAQATPDLVNLPGRRFVVAAEPENNAQMSTAVIKKLTERTEMMVRALNQNFFTFTPQHHVTLMYNDPPVVKAQDDGTWRRITVVQWQVRFIDEHERQLHPDAPLKDYGLPDRLMAELSGILNWLLDGLRLYLEQGLDPPESVKDATAQYRADNDPVGAFMRIALMPMQNAVIQGKTLYDAYAKWCEQSGIGAWSMAAFGRHAKRVLKAETKGVVRYLDVTFRPEFRGEIDV